MSTADEPDDEPDESAAHNLFVNFLRNQATNFTHQIVGQVLDVTSQQATTTTSSSSSLQANNVNLTQLDLNKPQALPLLAAGPSSDEVEQLIYLHQAAATATTTTAAIYEQSTWRLLLDSLFQYTTTGQQHHQLLVVNWFNVILAFVLVSFMLTTAIGNLFVIVAILIERNLRTIGNYLVLSLAIADLLVACLVMPLAGIYQILDRWTLGVLLCDIWTSTDVFCCTASILHLLAIALDRYWAVTRVDYIRCQRNERRILSMIFLVWMCACIISLAPAAGWKDAEYEARITHDNECLISQDIGFQIFATCTTFYFPLTLTLIFYWKIYQVARRRIRKKLNNNRVKLALQQPSSTSSASLVQTTPSVALTTNTQNSTGATTPVRATWMTKLAQAKCQSLVRYLPSVSAKNKLVTHKFAATNTSTLSNKQVVTIMDADAINRDEQLKIYQLKKECVCVCHKSNTDKRQQVVDCTNKTKDLNDDTQDRLSCVSSPSSSSVLLLQQPRHLDEPEQCLKRHQCRRFSLTQHSTATTNTLCCTNEQNNHMLNNLVVDNVVDNASKQCCGDKSTKSMSSVLVRAPGEPDRKQHSSSMASSMADIQTTADSLASNSRDSSPANTAARSHQHTNWPPPSTSSPLRPIDAHQDKGAAPSPSPPPQHRGALAARTSSSLSCLNRRQSTGDKCECCACYCCNEPIQTDNKRSEQQQQQASCSLAPMEPAQQLQHAITIHNDDDDDELDRHSTNNLNNAKSSSSHSPNKFRPNQNSTTLTSLIWHRLKSTTKQLQHHKVDLNYSHVVTKACDSIPNHKLQATSSYQQQQQQQLVACKLCNCLFMYMTCGTQLNHHFGTSSNKHLIENDHLIIGPATNVTAISTSCARALPLKQHQSPAQSYAAQVEGVESKRERKAAKTLAIITGVFVMCWLPFFVMAITMPLLQLKPHKYLFAFLLWLGYLNSMLNPIIYTIFSPDFRKAFKRLLCGTLDDTTQASSSSVAAAAATASVANNQSNQQQQQHKTCDSSSLLSNICHLFSERVCDIHPSLSRLTCCCNTLASTNHSGRQSAATKRKTRNSSSNIAATNNHHKYKNQQTTSKLNSTPKTMISELSSSGQSHQRLVNQPASPRLRPTILNDF